MSYSPGRVALIAISSVSVGALSLGGVGACGSDDASTTASARDNPDSGSGGSTGGGSGAGGNATGGSGGAGGGIGGGAGTDAGTIPVGECGRDAEGARSFCDAATWGGSVPTASTHVVVEGEVVVDCDAHAGSIEIPEGATLRASRAQSSTLTVHGNLVVRGRLDYGTPQDRVCQAQAEIVFTGMNDEAFEGTPSTGPDSSSLTSCCAAPRDTELRIIDSDYGVWVMGAGIFSAAGRAKRSWSKLVSGVSGGQKSFSVADASGWEVGDRVVLTPTAPASVSQHFLQFDEAEIAEVDAASGQVTLTQPTTYDHAGCSDCVRRGEAAVLSRNVVVRSQDATAHAHIIVGEQGRLQLDSVELRWLGPRKSCRRSEPQRRNPIHFHQQRDASRQSFVRHTSIWGSKNGFYSQELSHGVEVWDVVGYDTVGDGFSLHYDTYSCGTRCLREGFAPEDTVFRDVLAAKVRVPDRESGCAPIGSVTSISPSAGEGSGCDNCVAVASAYPNGVYGNTASGILFAESGSGRPSDLTFRNSEAHNNAGHGVVNWQNADAEGVPAFANISSWSNGGSGFHHGAYGNRFRYTNLWAVDNVETDFAVIAIQNGMGPRVDGALLDGFRTLPYHLVPTRAVEIKDARFSGVRNPAITQVPTGCTSGGDENDPNDTICIRNWLKFDNPQIPAGTKPFLFGHHMNRHSVWEVRNFSHPDYPDLPVSFDLHRKDNQVAGGAYYAPFDAWLVPK